MNVQGEHWSVENLLEAVYTVHPDNLDPWPAVTRLGLV